MGASVPTLYLITVLIWGSSWLAITFQLGTVEPLASVIYRFGAAAVLLFAWCGARKIPLALSRREHAFMFLQGSCLFGFNYWLMYLASQHLTSGLVAVVFSAIVFFNVLNARLFLGMAIRPQIVVGGILGMAGVALLFAREMQGFSLGDETMTGLAYALVATFIASLGNIVATRNSGGKRSVMAVNAWGMLYGTGVLVVVAWGLGVQYAFDFSARYLGSLFYLSVFGSIVTFASFLKLLAQIGPDKAGYVGMLVPVVALTLSSIFEDYSWSLPAVLGLCLILLGNWLAMRK